MKPSLLILAAGMGSRYGGLKQIDPVGPHKETIIEYSVYDAIRAGFGKIIFLIRKDIENAFRDSISYKFKHSIQVEFAYQEINMFTQGFLINPNRKKPWGTGHAVLSAQDKINVPFAIINGDDFYGTKSFELLYSHLNAIQDVNATDYAMCGFVLKNTLSEFGHVSRGICKVDKNSFLEGVVEYTHLKKENQHVSYTDKSGGNRCFSGNETVSMNMWGFTPSIFTYLKEQFDKFLSQSGNDNQAEFFLPTVIDKLIHDKLVNVKVLLSTDSWYGMTYPQDKQLVVNAVKNLIAKNIYPTELWKK